MNFAPKEEQKMLRDMVRKFCEAELKPIAAHLDETHTQPEEICRKLGAMGVMGVSVPEEYGGAGMDNVGYVWAVIEVAKACGGTGIIVSVNNSLYGHPVKTFGTHEQKLKYLTPVAGGQYEGCYGLTEASAGCDGLPEMPGRPERRQIHSQRRQDVHYQRSHCPLLCSGGNDRSVQGLQRRHQSGRGFT